MFLVQYRKEVSWQLKSYLKFLLVLFLAVPATLFFLSLAQNSKDPIKSDDRTNVQGEFINNETSSELSSDSKGSIPSTQIILLIVLLLISGFLSGSETSFTAVGQWKIRQLFEEGQQVFGILNRDPTRFITTCLIGSNLANIGATALITALGVDLANVFDWHQGITLSVTTGVMTVLVLIFGEITPKALAVHNAEAVARIAIYPIYVLSIAFYPIAKGFTNIASFVLRLFGLTSRNNAPLTEKELELIVHSASETGVIEAQERQMIQGVINLEETLVREVMTPRVKVIAIESNTLLKDAHQKLSEKMFSRLPVFEKTLDNIRGIFYLQDLLKFLNEPAKLTSTPVSELMTPPQYVPETMSILELMRKMRHSKIHMAIVIDEYGGTAGVITLEDVIEEITGEIYDETDVEKTAEIVNLNKKVYQIQGSTNLDKVTETLNLNFEEGDFDTLAGFLVSKFGYIPKKGESINVEDYTFRIEAADERRILSVLVGQERGNSLSNTHNTNP